MAKQDVLLLCSSAFVGDVTVAVPGYVSHLLLSGPNGPYAGRTGMKVVGVSY